MLASTSAQPTASGTSAAASSSRHKWAPPVNVSSASKVAASEQQRRNITATLLPPLIPDKPDTSLFLVTPPATAVITWAKFRCADRRASAEAVESVCSQVHAEVSHNAARWCQASIPSSSKGKERAPAGGWQEALTNQTLWTMSTQATSSSNGGGGGGSSSSSKTNAVVRDGQISSPQGTRDRASGTLDDGDATLPGRPQPTAAAPQTHPEYLWVFRIINEDNAPQQADSAAATPAGAGTAAPDGLDDAQTIEVPAGATDDDEDDDDLWGGSPSPTAPSPTIETGPPATPHLHLDCQPASRMLDEHLRQSLELVDEGTIPLSRLSTPTDDQLTEAEIGQADSQVSRQLRRAISARLADTYVARATAIRCSAGPLSGLPCGPSANDNEVSDADTLLPPDARLDGVDEEDGEITQVAEPAEASPATDPRLLALEQASRFLTIRHRHGFLLRDERPTPQLSIPSAPRRLAFAHFDVSWTLRTGQDDRGAQNPQTSAWLVRLIIEQSELVTLDSAGPAGARLLLGPCELEAERRPAHPSLRAGEEESFTQIKAELCRSLEHRAGIPAQELQQDRWMAVTCIGEQGRTQLIWPALLCYALAPSLEPLRRAATAPSVLSRLPLSAILEKTAALLQHQLTDNNDDEQSHKSASNVDSSASAAVQKPPTTDGLSDASRDSSAQPVKTTDDRTAQSKAAPEHEDDGNPADEDADLFGSDPEDSQPAAASNSPESYARPSRLTSRRPSKSEMDDGMYGLVTEDDFAFFDGDDDGDETEDQTMRPLADSAFDEGSKAADPALSQTEDMVMHDIPGSDEDRPARATQSTSDSISRPDAQMHNSASASSGPPTDPSTMPGYTPGSLTDTSPTTAGHFDRTPRTPASPCYDSGPLGPRIMPGDYPEPHEGWTPGMDTAMTPQSLNYIPSNHSVNGGTSLQRAMPQDQPHESEVKGTEPHRTLRDLGDKYLSGKFALPSSTAAGIAGTGKRSKMTNGVASAIRNQAPYLTGLKGGEHAGAPIFRRTRNALKADEEMSEPGTLASTASHSSDEDDEESEDSDTSSEADSERQRLERLAEWQQSYDVALECARWVGEQADATTRHGQSKAAGSLETAVASEVVDDDSTRGLDRDDCIEWLLSNPSLMGQGVSSMGSAYSLPDTLDHASRLALLGICAPDAPVLPLCPGDSNNDPSDKVFPSSSVEILEPPSILVGCQGSLTRLAPSALAFWEKLGLSPAGGSRKVTAMLLYHSGVLADWIAEAQDWLNAARKTFAQLGFGTLDLMQAVCLESAEMSGQDIVGAVADSLADPDRREETLSSLISRFQQYLGPDEHVVLYAVGDMPTDPAGSLPLLSLQTGLRQTAAKDVGEWRSHIHVRPLDWSVVAPAGSTGRLSALQAHACSLYDSLQVATQSRAPCQIQPVATSHVQLVRMPRFVLSAEASQTVPFSFSDRTATMDHRYPAPAYSRLAFVHVAYEIVQMGGEAAMCVSIMDEFAQQSQVKTFRHSSATLGSSLRRVFELARAATRNSDERTWRICICKYGSTSAAEMREWAVLAKGGLFGTAPCLEVIVACLDRRTPFLTTQSASSRADSEATGHTLFDASQVSFALYPQVRVPVAADGTCGEVEPLLSSQTSVVVTAYKGVQDVEIPRQGQTAPLPLSSPEVGSHCSWFHLLASYAGGVRAIARTPGSTEGQVGGPPGPDVSPVGTAQKMHPETIREATRSLFKLSLVTKTQFPAFANRWCPWPIAVLDVTRRSLPVLISAVGQQGKPVVPLGQTAGTTADI
ncbi:unnamed protein product [Parajaminaea phylloscopi]